jgi:hypothetical protein
VGGDVTDYRAQVELAARAVNVRSASTYTWFGRPSAARSPLWATLPAERLREHLVETLATELYQSFYVHGRPLPRRSSPSAPAPDPAFLERLSAANTGCCRWDPGWMVAGRDDEVLTLVRDGLRVRAPVADCDPPHGPLVRVRRPSENRATVPGMLLIDGEAPRTPPALEVRLYFHLASVAAPALVAALTSGLNAIELPFRLKLPAHPLGYRRCDAGVLYLGAEAFPRARETLRAALAACAGAWREPTPPFTKSLARGLAVAEHRPDDGDSFGSSRCHWVAEGLVEAHEQGLDALEPRVAAVGRRFAARGISLDRPFLAPGSHARYRL